MRHSFFVAAAYAAATLSVAWPSHAQPDPNLSWITLGHGSGQVPAELAVIPSTARAPDRQRPTPSPGARPPGSSGHAPGAIPDEAAVQPATRFRERTGPSLPLQPPGSSGHAPGRIPAEAAVLSGPTR